MDNIIFIGMPAVGKSTVGVVTAKRLGYQFIDTDLLIQEQEGKLLKEIIEEQGNDGFLKVEDRVNAGVEAYNDNFSRWQCGLLRKCYEALQRDRENSIFASFF